MQPANVVPLLVLGRAQRAELRPQPMGMWDLDQDERGPFVVTRSVCSPAADPQAAAGAELLQDADRREGTP